MNIDSLLKEISPDAPTGENLEYDPAFVELERAAESRPEQTLGDASVAGEPADWNAVRKGATELFSRTKDLRVAVLLTRALLNRVGISGFANGLTLIQGLLEAYWEGVHPQLDPDDDNDPTLRVNTIAMLCDRDATLHALSQVHLVEAKGLGKFGLKDIQVAKGDAPAPEGDESKMADFPTISAAFMDCPIEDLKATSEALISSQASVAAIDALLTGKVGSAEAANLTPLVSMLKDAAVMVNETLAKRGEVVENEGGGSQGNTAAAQVISGEINSREDAARMMDKISDYFKRNEPSSPVPLLMQRAKRLSSLGFMEILKDIAPDGLKQAQNIGGIDGSGK